MTEVRTPNDTNRTIVLGRTGTGKSQFAINLLSEQNWNEIPWVIIDFKGEDLLEDILNENPNSIRIITPKSNPPKSPGLYYMKCNPIDDDELIEVFMRKMHKQGNIGLYVDEGYMMPKFGNTPGFTLLQTQGRSLHIPMICLYQRPVWMSRFAIAQSDFRAIFKQDDNRDEKVIKEFVKSVTLPNGQKLGPTELEQLPDYYCLWYDVGRGKTAILQPAPDRNIILQKFRSRLYPQAQRKFV